MSTNRSHEREHRKSELVDWRDRLRRAEPDFGLDPNLPASPEMLAFSRALVQFRSEFVVSDAEYYEMTYEGESPVQMAYSASRQPNGPQ